MILIISIVVCSLRSQTILGSVVSERSSCGNSSYCRASNEVRPPLHPAKRSNYVATDGCLTGGLSLISDEANESHTPIIPEKGNEHLVVSSIPEQPTYKAAYKGIKEYCIFYIEECQVLESHIVGLYA